jgi:Tol biopolymer transport system component
MDDEVRSQTLGANTPFTDPDNVPLPFLWSPSRDALYFEGNSRGVRGLWKLPVDPATLRWSGAPTRLTTSADLSAGLSLSRDGGKLAFAARNERVRLWSYRVDPASRQLLDRGEAITPDTYDARSPVISQDGTTLLYETERAGNQMIHIRTLTDSAEKVLVGGDGYRRAGAVWSDDDSRIAYARSRSNPYGTAQPVEVVSIPAAGGPEQVLTTPAPFAELFDWSAAGGWFLGSLRPRSGMPHELVLATARGTSGHDVRVLATDTGSNVWNARLSPDRRWVVFTGAINPAAAGIIVVSAAGGAQIPVTTGETFDDRAHWSRDGRLIYFLSNRSGFLNLWARPFDPDQGLLVGEPFALTHFDGPVTTVPVRMAQMGIAIAADRAILPISEASGNIWILDGLKR